MSIDASSRRHRATYRELGPGLAVWPLCVRKTPSGANDPHRLNAVCPL